MAQLLPHLSSAMFRDMPDQTVKILNELIDEVNELRRNR